MARAYGQKPDFRAVAKWPDLVYMMKLWIERRREGVRPFRYGPILEKKAAMNLRFRFYDFRERLRVSHSLDRQATLDQLEAELEPTVQAGQVRRYYDLIQTSSLNLVQGWFIEFDEVEQADEVVMEFLKISGSIEKADLFYNLMNRFTRHDFDKAIAQLLEDGKIELKKVETRIFVMVK